MALAYEFEYVETDAEREEAARVRAREALRNHRGLLLSLTVDQMRSIPEMDPGPTTEVGKPPA